MKGKKIDPKIYLFTAVDLYTNLTAEQFWKETRHCKMAIWKL